MVLNCSLEKEEEERGVGIILNCALNGFELNNCRLEEWRGVGMAQWLQPYCRSNVNQCSLLKKTTKKLQFNFV